jgi:hypothetical protein
MKSSLTYILTILFLMPVCVQASSECLNFLSQNVSSLASDLKPMNGVLIELSPRESVFALGPYFGGTHQSLLFNLKNKYRIKNATVRWAGEVLVSVKNQRPTVHQTNERAVSLVSQRLRAAGYNDGVDHDSSLDVFNLEKNDFRSLQRFFKSGAITVSKDYEHITRASMQQAIVPLNESSPLASMFEFRTEVTHLVMTLHTLLNQGPRVGTEERLKSALKLLEIYVQDYLLYYLNDNPLVLKKIEEALILFGEILNSEVSVFDLNNSRMRALHESVLFVSNVTLQNVNPGLLYDYKVRR